MPGSKRNTLNDCIFHSLQRNLLPSSGGTRTPSSGRCLGQGALGSVSFPGDLPRWVPQKPKGVEGSADTEANTLLTAGRAGL